MARFSFGRVAALALALLLLPTAAATAAPVELTGRMTISTARAGSTLVNIARPTETFPKSDGTGAVRFKFAGNASLRTLVLLAEAPGAGGTRWAGYVDGSLFDDGEGSWTSTTIPAGVYRLYAMTDGSPVTVTVTMPEGGADAALGLPDPAAVDVHKMQAGSMGVFRAAASTTGPGVVFGVAGERFASGQAGTLEFCDAVGEAADADAAYALGCSQGDSLFPVVGGTDFESVTSSTVSPVNGPTHLGYGGNGQSVSQPEILGAVGALTFTASAQPSGTVAPVLGTAARVVSARARVKSGRAPVRVRCTGPGRCHVRLAVANSKSKGKALIPEGKTRTVSVRLASALRKRLKRSRSRSVRVTLVLEVGGDSGGTTNVTRSRVTFILPHG
ncbi:MAG: hypothetical protein QOI98_1185 [Solirubrobacteraceae bacterium]|nr:hypothetical protein [Solirubrobacteraceae bacterium]